MGDLFEIGLALISCIWVMCATYFQPSFLYVVHTLFKMTLLPFKANVLSCESSATCIHIQYTPTSCHGVILNVVVLVSIVFWYFYMIFLTWLVSLIAKLQFVFVTYFTNPSVSDRVLCKLIFVKNVVSVEHAMFYVFLPNAVHIWCVNKSFSNRL